MPSKVMSELRSNVIGLVFVMIIGANNQGAFAIGALNCTY